jgi:hypothetical protein
LIDLVSKSRRIEKSEAAKIIIEASGGMLNTSSSIQVYHNTRQNKKEAVIPIPEDALITFKASGAITQSVYRDFDGKAWCVVGRFNQSNGGKKVIPYFFDGTDWQKGNPLKLNRPLFNSDKLKNNKMPVLIVEGEKCASIEVVGYIVVTWIGGCSAVYKSDFSILQDREVFIWPDADIAGFEAAKKIKTLLPHAEILNTKGKPQGWDIADAVADGINPLNFIESCLQDNQNPPSKIENQETNDVEKPGRPRKSNQALELLSTYKLCRFKDKRYMIRGNQAIPIGSRMYKEFVQGEFFRSTGTPLTSAQMDEVINIHRAYAGESEEKEIYIRTAAPSNNTTYIDLNDGYNTIIEVDQYGFRESVDPPVLFFRPSNMGALPMPVHKGSINHLKQFINLEREEDFRVFIAFLAYILRGRTFNRGSYPILITTGPEGSAKTTFMKITKKTCDPGTPETRIPSGDTRDIFIAANNCHVLSLDNISKITQEMSDALCSLTTGGGYARKMNYADDEEQIFDVSRPVLLNGISFDKAPDLLSRSIIIELKPIKPEERKTEVEIWTQFERHLPSILGALLSILSNTMKEEAKMSNERFILPRLADFGRFSIALERGNGWEVGGICASIKSSYDAALSENAEANPLIPLIINLVQETGLWRGNASELLRLLTERADNFDKRLSTWPKTPAKLGTMLRREENVLLTKGIITSHPRVNNTRWIEFSLANKSKPVIVNNIPDFDSLPTIDTL